MDIDKGCSVFHQHIFINKPRVEELSKTVSILFKYIIGKKLDAILYDKLQSFSYTYFYLEILCLQKWNLFPVQQNVRLQKQIASFISKSKTVFLVLYSPVPKWH